MPLSQAHIKAALTLLLLIWLIQSVCPGFATVCKYLHIFRGRRSGRPQQWCHIPASPSVNILYSMP